MALTGFKLGFSFPLNPAFLLVFSYYQGLGSLEEKCKLQKSPEIVRYLILIHEVTIFVILGHHTLSDQALSLETNLLDTVTWLVTERIAKQS